MTWQLPPMDVQAAQRLERVVRRAAGLWGWRVCRSYAATTGSVYVHIRRRDGAAQVCIRIANHPNGRAIDERMQKVRVGCRDSLVRTVRFIRAQGLRPAHAVTPNRQSEPQASGPGRAPRDERRAKGHPPRPTRSFSPCTDTGPAAVRPRRAQRARATAPGGVGVACGKAQTARVDTESAPRPIVDNFFSSVISRAGCVSLCHQMSTPGFGLCHTLARYDPLGQQVPKPHLYLIPAIKSSAESTHRHGPGNRRTSGDTIYARLGLDVSPRNAVE